MTAPPRRLMLLLSTSIVLFSAFSLYLNQSKRAEPPPPLPGCSEAEAQAALDDLRPYTPSLATGFARIQSGNLLVGESEYRIHGVNYYPARYPWRRFLTESDIAAVRAELVLLQAAGFNTLRLFVWNEALFTCPKNGAIPKAAAFHRLDAIIGEAAAHGFRLVVTLNDLPDLADYPLYSSPPHVDQQTAFIIERYRDEAAILAWDLRNEGDIDYGSNHALAQGAFSREDVLAWLARTAELARKLDGQHLLTAGWLHDADSTAPYVDFVSFHHWEDASTLRQRIAALREQTDQPILLEEVGYSTYRVTPEEQRRLLADAIEAAEDEGLLGWLIWTAFDFPLDATCIPPACPSADNAEHHFGLWYPDYTLKPAVSAVTRAMQP